MTNLSRDRARAVVDVPVPSSIDVGHAPRCCSASAEADGDGRLRKMMLDEPSVRGVERIEVDVFSVRMVARTLPGMQFDVGREILARVTGAFLREGVIVSAELDTGHPTRDHP